VSEAINVMSIAGLALCLRVSENSA